MKTPPKSASQLLAMALFTCSLTGTAQTITSIAGSGPEDGRSASSTAVFNPGSLAMDSQGRLHFTDPLRARVRRVELNGTVVTVAGIGFIGFGGDGGLARQALLNYPNWIAMDSSDNLLIADLHNRRVRKVSPSGTISTIAGNGAIGSNFGGDGTPATDTALGSPYAVAADASGNVFIADQSYFQQIFRVDSTGNIYRYAGIAGGGTAGDGGPATSAGLAFPWGMAPIPGGGLLIAEAHRIRKVDAAGTISTVAGQATTCGFPADGSPASESVLCNPTGLAMDSTGRVIIGAEGNNRVMQIGTDGIIRTLAGSGAGGFSGDGGPATSATLSLPRGVVHGPDGSTYVADQFNHRIRRISSDGTISTVVGTGAGPLGFTGEIAAGSDLYRPEGVAVDSAGNAYIADSSNHRVRKIAADGTISTFAGTGYGGFNGSGEPATGTHLNQPRSVTIDASGNIIVLDRINARILRISPTGIVLSVIGNGTQGFSGDGGSANSAQISGFGSVLADSAGNIFIADAGNHRIRRVNSSGIIVTIAGDGTPGFAGDSGPALSARLSGPAQLALDSQGNLYVADEGNGRIRKITPGGIISTIAGNGTYGFQGDGGPALSASFRNPFGVAVDAAGNVYVADSTNHRVRKIETDGTIQTIAGDGTAGYSGDGQSALQASLSSPYSLTTAADGSIFVADRNNHAVRRIVLTAPSSPTNVSATAGNAAITVSFSQGATGGSRVLDFTVTCNASSSAGSYSSTGGASPITVTGLTNGVTYACTVTARNSIGISPASAASAPVATIATYTLTVGKTGSGAAKGKITASAAGIDCGSDCTESLPAGTRVTLYAVPQADSGVIPNGFSGVTCEEALPGACTFTLNADTQVSANFSTLLTFGNSSYSSLPPQTSRTIPYTLCAGDSPLVAGSISLQFTSSSAQIVPQLARDLNGNQLIDAGEEFSWSNPLPDPLAAGTCTVILVRVTFPLMGAIGDSWSLSFGARHPQMPPGAQVRATLFLMVADDTTLTIRVVGSGTTWPYLPNNPSDVRDGQTLHIEARPAPSWRFSHWSGMPCPHGITLTVCAVQIPSLERSAQWTITANFVEDISVTSSKFDFNDDGRGDILWRNADTGENYFYPMDGRNILATEGYVRTVAAPWGIAGVGDFDGDGKADILWRNSATGENYIYFMNGNVVLPSEGYIRSVPTNWVLAGVGDFSGDGRADILWRNTATGENYIYFMNGLAISSGEGYIRSVPTNWVVATVDDFDGDRKADILWRNTATGENYLYPMDGRTIRFNEGFIRSVPTAWIVAGSGDFDGDGKADILWRNTSTGENYLYFMDLKTIKPTEGPIRSVAAGWTVASVTDFDADGKADILWRNSTTSENYIYPMDARTIKSTEGFIRTVPPAWSVVSK